MIRSVQVGTNGLGAGRPTSNLEKPLTNGVSLSFHDTPRQYALAQKTDTTKSKDGTSVAVFALRSSPQIIEEDSSDEELEQEDQDDDNMTAYSFPCEGRKINELVSKVASLSLRTGLSTAHPTITPTRVHVPAFVPPLAPVSPVAVIYPVTAHASTAEHATPMEVNENVPHPEVANKGAPRPQGIPDAMPMEGVVFHPEVKDVEMSEAFATNRKLLQVTHLYYLSLTQQQRELRLSAPQHVGLAAPGLPIVAHALRSEPPGIRKPHYIEHKGTSSERHLLPRTRLVYSNVPFSTSYANPPSLLLSLIPPHLPLVPTAALSTLAPASLCPPASSPCASSKFTGRISAHAFVSRLLRVGSLCLCFDPSGCFDTSLLSISERSLIGSSVALVYWSIYHSISLV